MIVTYRLAHQPQTPVRMARPGGPKGALRSSVQRHYERSEVISVIIETASFLAVTNGSPFRGLGLKN